jgi:hypothetical protein
MENLESSYTVVRIVKQCGHSENSIDRSSEKLKIEIAMSFANSPSGYIPKRTENKDSKNIFVHAYA